MDHDIPTPAIGEYTIGSCHTIPSPPEVGFGFVSAHASRGEITISSSVGGSSQRDKFRPASPLYDLNNPACSGNLVLPVNDAQFHGAIVTVTICNDSKEDGFVMVLAGAGYAVASNQPKVVVHRKLPSKNSTMVNIVFVSPH